MSGLFSISVSSRVQQIPESRVIKRIEAGDLEVRAVCCSAENGRTDAHINTGDSGEFTTAVICVESKTCQPYFALSYLN